MCVGVQFFFGFFFFCFYKVCVYFRYNVCLWFEVYVLGLGAYV
jgi:hypothetical protein